MRIHHKSPSRYSVMAAPAPPVLTADFKLLWLDTSHEFVNAAFRPFPQPREFAREAASCCCLQTKEGELRDGLPTLLDDLAHAAVVLAPVLLEQTRGLRVSRRVRVRIAQQRLDGREDRRDVVDRGPLVLQNVQADLTVIVDCTAARKNRQYSAQHCNLLQKESERTIRVEHLGDKLDGRRLVRVVLAKLERQVERAALPRRVVRPATHRINRY